MRLHYALGIAGMISVAFISAAAAGCRAGVASADNFTLVSPVDRPISEHFGAHVHPVLQIWRGHTGVDFAAAIGEPVKAAAGGQIAVAKWMGEHGNRIEIHHGQGISTTYSHMSRFAAGIENGRCVEAGEVVGNVGATGLIASPHLHFEVLRDRVFFDPELYLPK